MKRLSYIYTPAALVALLVSAGLGAIMTVEVLFLRESLDAGFLTIGTLLGLAAVGALLFVPFLTVLVQRMGRGRYLLWTLLFLALAAIGASTLTDAGLYLAVRLVISLFAPLVIPTVAYAVHEEFRFARNREVLLAFITTLATLGGALGAVAAGMLADAFSLAHGYMLAAFLFITAAFLSANLPNRTEQVSFRSRRLESLHVLVRNRPYLTLALVGFALQAHAVVREFIIPLLVRQQGGSYTDVGILFGLVGLAGLVAMLPVHRLLARNPSGSVLVVALTVLGVATLMLPFGGLLVLGGALFVLGIGEAGARPSLAEAGEEAAKRDVERVKVGLAMVATLALAITPFTVGALLAAGTPERVVLFFSAAGMLVVLVQAHRVWGGRTLFPRLHWGRKQRLSW